MSIEIQNVSKSFGTFAALSDVSLTVPNGKLMAWLGPSGSGKTTLLRILGGLEFGDCGKIFFDNEDITDVPTRLRQVGFVFQNYALFGHMTVFQNVAFGLTIKSKGPSKSEIREKVMDLLQKVQLEHLAHRYPNQLSGGQSQRIALARALAVNPRFLLLDEPFGALDAQVRKELRRWIRQLHEDLGLTTIFVTHDQEEALEVADQVVIMNQGKIEQIGTPQQVYDAPATPFVYRFLGNVNVLPASINKGKIKFGRTEMVLEGHATVDHSETLAFVRPHEIEISRKTLFHSAGLEVIIQKIHSAGPIAKLSLSRLDNAEKIQAEVPRRQVDSLNLKEGESVLIRIQNARVFQDDYSI